MNNSMSVKISEVLRKAPVVALFSHVSPDGDCIGSMLAIGAALQKMGKQVYYYNPDAIPQNLLFLSGASEISSVMPDELPDTLLFVDCADLQRANFSKADIPENCTVLNVDHHISNEFFGHFNWVDSEASASGEVAYALIKELGAKIDKNIATSLYTAIVTDTGSFQYGNTTAKTHYLTAELMEKDINLTEIHHHIFEQKPLAQIKLLQRALNRLEFFFGSQLSVITLTTKDFRESGAEENLSEGMVNYARTISGVEVAVLLREVADNGVKVGLRSNNWLNVNEIAAQFGGGGHKRAAGCTLSLPISEAKKKIIAAIEEALKGGRNN